MFASNTSQVSSDATYIEDVFSTYLYTGNGSTQTITNGIDLAGRGGLLWIKNRNEAYEHSLFDTARGINNILVSNSTGAQSNLGSVLTALSSGFTLTSGSTGYPNLNDPSYNYASWTFRKAPKFFDVVTYTGTGSNTTIAHNLGSVPGCIIVKRTDTTSNWAVWHVELGNGEYLQLNTTSAKTLDSTVFQSTNPTSTIFRVGTSSLTNASGGTYVAYLFASDAGGFGLTGTDNVISCGSFTTDGVGSTQINLGYEPQWIMFKKSSAASQWYMFDTMRGLTTYSLGYDQYLWANSTGAEGTSSVGGPNATGFEADEAYFDAGTWIYVAIRRGPMKVPTDATKVFTPVIYTGSGGTQTITSNFPVDLAITDNRTKTSAAATDFKDRLRGSSRHLGSQYTYEEQSEADSFVYFDRNNSVGMGVGPRTNDSGVSYVTRLLRRAPGFFDEVCYTGTGTNTTQKHNLKVAPELMIIKERSGVANWVVYSSAIWGTGVGGTSGYDLLLLNTTGKAQNWNGVLNNTAPTATDIYLGDFGSPTNGSGSTYVAYLFASCPGVSKVFNFTGNGSSQTINCGFTGGARFVMIKRTDSTGDWYIWDSARGIVSGNDPRLSLNTTAAEVTTDDSVDTDSTGFVVNQLSATNINVNGASYIGLAIA